MKNWLGSEFVVLTEANLEARTASGIEGELTREHVTTSRAVGGWDSGNKGERLRNAQ